MASKWAGSTVGLAGGFATGIVLAVMLGHGPNLMSGYEVCQANSCVPLGWSEWLREGGLGDYYALSTSALGAALAGLLAAAGLMRWSGILSAVLVVATSSLTGAIISVPGSLLLVCTLWGPSYMACSGEAALRLAVELPFVFAVFVVMTTIVGLLARRIGRADRT